MVQHECPSVANGNNYDSHKITHKEIIQRCDKFKANFKPMHLVSKVSDVDFGEQS